MATKIAFIGAGNMGSAILRGVCRSTDPANILVADANTNLVQSLCQELHCTPAGSNGDAAAQADILFLCVKPQVMPLVMAEIAPVLQKRAAAKLAPTLVSIAAGIPIASIRQMAGIEDIPIVRIMPNNPAFIGKGVMLIAGDGSASEDILAQVEALAATCGTTSRLAESLMDPATVVASCSPAFVYLFIEALADGGVQAGLSRDQAMTLAAAAVQGSAAMVLEYGKHPAQLKDMVCSPAGSTIAGVSVLEQRAFRSAVIDAVAAACKRNQELGK